MMIEENKEYWIELASGARWYPGRDDNHVDIEDIANSLAKLCRFSGHCRYFYSVAEHSVKVSWLVEKEDPSLAFTALLHDAHEALVNDLPKPIKAHIGGSYEELEKRAEQQIAEQFLLPYPHPSIIKHYDNVMLFVEAHELLPSKGKDWGFPVEYSEEAEELVRKHPKLAPAHLSWKDAKHMFMEKYHIVAPYFNLNKPVYDVTQQAAGQ